MHLARRFIQSDLHWHSSYSFYQLLLSLGIEPMILVVARHASTIWATGKPINVINLLAYYVKYVFVTIIYDHFSFTF